MLFNGRENSAPLDSGLHQVRNGWNSFGGGTVMTNASAASRAPVFERVGERIAGNVQKWLPDPFLFAILLTFIALVMGMFIASKTSGEMVQYWYKGFWTLHTFAMQMVLILVTGYVLAHAPFIRPALVRIADLPRTGAQGVVLVTVLAL